MTPTPDPDAALGPDAGLGLSEPTGRLTMRSVDGLAAGEADVIRLHEETARIETRAVEGETVSIRKVVQERDDVVETLLRNETVEVERVRLDQVVATAPGMREEGDVLIVPVLEEILVVEKRLILREEIRIRRTQQMQPTQQTVRLRREEAQIERTPPANPNPKET